MRSNKRNNKLSYFLTLLLCLCMLVGCGSGAATQVMLKAEDSETESYVETVQTESAENDPGDETEIQTAAETEIQDAAQVQSDDSKQKVVHTGTASAMQQMFRHIPGNHIQLSTIMNPILHRII